MPIKRRKNKKISSSTRMNVLPTVKKIFPNKPLHCPAGKMGSHATGGTIQR